MDFPLSQLGLDLYNGRFTDGIPGVRPASIIPSSTTNAIVDELQAVIVAGGLTPDEATFTQVRDAILSLVENAINEALVAASVTDAGIVELATSAETIAGTDAGRAVTPAGLAAKVASDTASGIVELATLAETIAGIDIARAVTPAGLAAAFDGQRSLTYFIAQF